MVAIWIDTELQVICIREGNLIARVFQLSFETRYTKYDINTNCQPGQVPPTLNVNPTLFLTPCKKLGIIELQSCNYLSLTK